MNGNDVIVGIDGTPASDEALRWAAAEATRTGSPLKVVIAAAHPGEWATLTVAAAVDCARAHRPGLQVTGRAVSGQPVDVLTGLAADAALVVVGSHGHTALAAALRGATGARVALRAPGRVVVVRGRIDAGEGPVAVGVDGSHTDNRLLAAAFEQAARRGCEVLAVRAVPGVAGQERADLLAELTDDLERWSRRYPTVPAFARTPDLDPAAALLDASGEARLLVLGGRTHGPAAALLAGSVGQRLLYHAGCPLLIVHGGARD
ncbi:universal stress protein [Dactylosporangium darangshiense]|uniref:Universal stress protein n=1 Tax=Dactylosporangium darangshiense TaxID=579108 RepID=A0ABP8DSX0_9ACTN